MRGNDSFFYERKLRFHLFTRGRILMRSLWICVIAAGNVRSFYCVLSLYSERIVFIFRLNIDLLIYHCDARVIPILQ